MPVSVDQPSKLIVSSSDGGLIKVSIVSTTDTKLVSINEVAANNITISGAIGAGPAGPQGSQGEQGPQGETGPAGADGADGVDGVDGVDGQGVAAGGSQGQVLAKASSTDYDTEWIDVDNVLASSITISNNDNAFAHMSSPISAGTSLEAVLRDMLEKYNITTITLNAVKAAYQNTDGSYPATANKSSFATLEVGRGVKSDGFTFSIGDTSQTSDNSVLFKIDGTTVTSGISETGSPATYTANTLDPGTATSKTYTVQATDNGSGTNYTISGNKSVTWRYLVRLATATTNSIADNTAAQTLYDSGLTNMASNLNSGSTWSNVLTTSDSNSQSNYTYIVFPAAWGDLQSVVQDLSLPVLGAFTDLGDFTIDNQYGVSISYSFYVSNQTAAFASGTRLDITF